MRILVANAGSSSVKLRLLDDDDRVLDARDLPVPQGGIDTSAAESAIASMEPVDVVGHRVVHGGGRFTRAVRVDDEVEQGLRDLIDLAPLHQPAALALLSAVRRALPDVPSIACFDTAFHAGLPDAASTYALPAEWRTRWGLRRFGFHGLSHAYASRIVRAWDGTGRSASRVVTCHLGAGTSLAAVLDGKSVETTMGFTPLEGLVMATRSGSVDPGLVLWLQERTGMRPEELAFALEHRSGLLGLAGTADMREILLRAGKGDADARLAFDVYVHRLRGGIAAMAAAMGGLDALAFTGGVGENAAAVRAAAAAGLGFLGVALDETMNQAGGDDDREIGTEGAVVRTFVVHSREDLEIARQVREEFAAGNGDTDAGSARD